MTSYGNYPEIAVDIEDYIATVEVQRGPHNFFHLRMIGGLADAFEALQEEPSVRAIVLCTEGKNFCAGAALGSDSQENSPTSGPSGGGDLYVEAVRLFSTQNPIVAAVQGSAIGGGFGLAMMADFRVASPESRFSANFARLGFHQGFGLSVTLPDAIGKQGALDMFYTGRRVKGEEAYRLGVCDYLVPSDELRAKAREVALEIAHSAPLAIRSIRNTMRGELADRVKAATDHELAEQDRLRQTNDFQEGVTAMAERRQPNFQGN